jgi:hypothetical protein
MVVRVQELAEYVPIAEAPPDLSREEKEARKIMCKRHEELSRRQRIFDAKRRTIGIDKMVLDQQVADRHMGDQLVKERSAHFDEQALYFNNVIKMQELEATRKRREIEKQCKDYSRLHLGKEARDTFYLEDPNQLKEDLPPRHPDVEHLCGPSSFQVFAGEDPCRAGRTKQQHRQQRDWIEQQRFEKAMLKEQTHDGDMAFAQHNAQVSEVRGEIESDERLTRLELEKARQKFNLQMQDDRTLDNARLKEVGECQASGELDRNINPGGFAFEHEDGVRGGPEFKGLGRDALDAVVRTREEQVLEKHDQKQAEWEHDAGWAQHGEGVRRGLVQQLQHEQRTKRGMMEQMVRDNQAIAAAKRQDEQYRKTRVYQNECSEDFWKCFGTTSR